MTLGLQRRPQASANLHAPVLGEEANAAHEDLMELEIELHSFHAFSERVWDLRHNVAIYDGWYVALAEAVDLPLATLDDKLVKAEGPQCRFLTPDSGK